MFVGYSNSMISFQWLRGAECVLFLSQYDNKVRSAKCWTANLLGFFHCSFSPNPWQMNSSRSIVQCYPPSPHHSLTWLLACHDSRSTEDLPPLASPGSPLILPTAQDSMSGPDSPHWAWSWQPPLWHPSLVITFLFISAHVMCWLK